MSSTATATATFAPGTEAIVRTQATDNIEVMQHNGQFVYVLAPLDTPVGAMYSVRASDGSEFTVFPHELTAA